MARLDFFRGTRRRIGGIAFGILVIVLGLFPLAVQAAERAALVIGNQRYTMGALETPEADARAVGDRLRAAGYQVTRLVDLGQTEFYNAVDAFFSANARAKVLLFFYAGHGVQVNGRNFLIPVDMRQDDPDILSRMFDLRYLMGKLNESSSETKVVILDACRDNLFSSNPNAASGLSELISPPGTFVAFSTAPGATASDGEGDHSPYTVALLENAFRPKVKIEEAFKSVRKQVGLLTKGAQTPWENTSLVQDFYLVPELSSAAADGKKQGAGAKSVPRAPAEGQADENAPVDTQRCSRILAKISIGVGIVSEADRDLLLRCRK